MGVSAPEARPAVTSPAVEWKKADQQYPPVKCTQPYSTLGHCTEVSRNSVQQLRPEKARRMGWQDGPPERDAVIQCSLRRYPATCSSSTCASWRSTVSKPSV